MKRPTKIQKSAKGEGCTVRIFGTCNFNPETTVYAHVGIKGEATNKRNGDEARNGCYACSDCHDAIDYRSRVYLSDDKRTQEIMHDLRRVAVVRAKHRTQEILKAKGLLPK